MPNAEILLHQALRRQDPDRYLSTLFAPAGTRGALVVLYAFNHELARAPEIAREPGLALIRLQWWREVVEGAVRAQEVATPLHAALAAGHLHAPDLLAMLDAREHEVEAVFPTVASWRNWLLLGAGSLGVAAARALGAPASQLDRMRQLGAGYGAAGQLRNLAANARRGRCLLPADLLHRSGLTPETLVAAPPNPALTPVRAAVAQVGLSLLGDARSCGRDWVAAALPAVLARRDLAHPHRPAAPRPFGDRFAVTRAAIAGRA